MKGNIIVRLKEKGDFDTIFAYRVDGSLKDDIITAYVKHKSGAEKKIELSTEAVEAIERNYDENDDESEDKEAEEEQP